MASLGGAIGSVFGGGGLSIGMVVGIFTAVLAVIGLAWYYFRNLRSGRIYKHKLKNMVPGVRPAHRVDVDILRKRGDSWTKQKDKAARIEDKDGSGEKYHLLKTDHETPAVDYEYVGTGPDGNAHVTLLRHGHKEYQPVRPDFDNDSFVHDNLNMREWFAQELKEQNSYWDEEELAWYETDMAKWIAIGFGMLLILVGGGYYITKVNESIVKSLRAYDAAKQFIPVLYLAWRDR